MGGRGAVFGVNDGVIRTLREKKLEATLSRNTYIDYSNKDSNPLTKQAWKRRAAVQKSIITKLNKQIEKAEKNNYKVRGNPNNSLTWVPVK